MLKLLITNSDGPFDIKELVSQIDWSGDYLQCARTLSFNLLSSPMDKLIPAVKCDLGNAVTLMLDDRTLFEGFVFERQKNTAGSRIDVICFDRGIYLKRNKTSYKFTKLTSEAIAKRVCTDFGIDTGEIVTTGIKISRNFLGSTLYDIIQTAYTLASAETKKKYHVTFKGSKLCVLEKKVTDATLVIEGGTNLMDASITDSITNMVNQVAIYDKNDKLLDKVKNEEAIKLYGLMQEYLKQREGENTGTEAQKILDDNGVQQKITINNLGNAANVTGGTVVVREPHTGLYGLFYIDSDIHTWKNGLYLNKLALNFKNIMDEKEVGTLPNKTGSKTAEAPGSA
ncbi:MAG: XkdQ/YqbQ family protein [Peptococcaceae bacterium]